MQLEEEESAFQLKGLEQDCTHQECLSSLPNQTKFNVNHDLSWQGRDCNPWLRKTNSWKQQDFVEINLEGDPYPLAEDGKSAMLNLDSIKHNLMKLERALMG